MKKLVLSVMLLIMCNIVLAQTWVDKYYGIEWKGSEKMQAIEPSSQELSNTDSCSGNQMYTAEIPLWNQEESFQKCLKNFRDGYHVVYLGEPYKGYSEYTAYKEDGEVLWIKSGECTNGKSYRKYSIDVDLESKETEIRDAWHNHELNAFVEGWRLVNAVEGVSAYQKVRCAMLAKDWLSNNDMYQVSIESQEAVALHQRMEGET